MAPPSPRNTYTRQAEAGIFCCFRPARSDRRTSTTIPRRAPIKKRQPAANPSERTGTLRMEPRKRASSPHLPTSQPRTPYKESYPILQRDIPKVHSNEPHSAPEPILLQSLQPLPSSTPRGASRHLSKRQPAVDPSEITRSVPMDRGKPAASRHLPVSQPPTQSQYPQPDDILPRYKVHSSEGHSAPGPLPSPSPPQKPPQTQPESSRTLSFEVLEASLSILPRPSSAKAQMQNSHETLPTQEEAEAKRAEESSGQLVRTNQTGQRRRRKRDFRGSGNDYCRQQ